MKRQNTHECEDCGLDTRIDPKDYYMVTAEVWNEFGLGGASWDKYRVGQYNSDEDNGMLCIGCLEKRMGRVLTGTDLTRCPLNYLNPYTRVLLPSLDEKD